VSIIGETRELVRETLSRCLLATADILGRALLSSGVQGAVSDMTQQSGRGAEQASL
jgi:hypothetical protein